jgi:general secretion pathway protein G
MIRPSPQPRTSRGFSYIEMLVVCSLLAVLASAVIPLVRWEDKRRREVRLRGTLAMMRSALDQYNKFVQEGLIQIEDVEQCALPAHLETCWPLDLETLVEGVEVGDPSSPDLRIVEFLARVPVDPITENTDWGLRSYQDDWDASSWGGENIYDVYSLASGQALDGSYYRDW